MIALGDLADEYCASNLGDERLSRRLVDLATMAAAEPAASFPKMTQHDSELEATYRFLSNDRISAEEILAPHRRQTALRAKDMNRVVVAHDTTEFNYGKSKRKDLGLVGQGKSHGFYAHVALAISGDEQRDALGVSAMEVHQRHGGRGRRSHRILQSDENNEFHRWRRVLQQSSDLLGLNPINVMDREADSYAFLAELKEHGHRFVVRMASDKRRIADGGNVEQALAKAPVIASREVPLTRRKASSMPNYNRLHPQRRARMAQLEMRAMTVTIKRPSSSNQSPAKTNTLSVVHVVEENPPEDQPEVEWRLWTTEPIETADDVLAIVDAYRARWRVEEYFKALKTGCALEKRQLETHEALVRTLFLFAPIAWRLLRLRNVAQRDDDTPAEKTISSIQLRCLALALKKFRKKELPPEPTARNVMFAIASLGGHLKRNGPPGWQTLGRGFDKLLALEAGFQLAMEAMGIQEM